MLENTLPQLEKLIEDIIEKNSLLEKQVAELEKQKLALMEENETLQLDALEGEEKQKQTSDVLASLLDKLQNVQEVKTTYEVD